MGEQAKPRVIFFGTPEIAAICLRALLEGGEYEVAAIITNPDRPAGRGKKVTPSPVKTVAESHRIPCITVDKIKADTSSFIDQVSKLGSFDIGVVVAFGQIIPQEVLNIPEKGCINVHGSLLPRWRGAAPMQRAIMEGDAVTGVQLMEMEAGLDTGAVYSTAIIPIDDTTTLQMLHDLTGKEGGRLLHRDLAKIYRGELVAVPQSTEGVTYAKKITNEEAKLNWNIPAEKLVRIIHGISPFPGAFTFYNNQRLKIFQAKNISRPNTTAQAPGIVTFAGGNELYVSCGDGSEIVLMDLQLEGKKRLHTKEFLVGTPIKVGEQLG